MALPRSPFWVPHFLQKMLSNIGLTYSEADLAKIATNAETIFKKITSPKTLTSLIPLFEQRALSIALLNHYSQIKQNEVTAGAATHDLLLSAQKLIDLLIDPKNFPPANIQSLIAQACGEQSSIVTVLGVNRLKKIISIVEQETKDTCSAEKKEQHETTEIYENISALYMEGELIPHNSYHAILYKNFAYAHRLNMVYEFKKDTVEIKQNLPSVEAIAKLSEIVENTLLIKLDDSLKKEYRLTFDALTGIFSKSRAAAIILVCAFLDNVKPVTNDEKFCHAIMSEIRDKLLYNHNDSISAIVNSVCNYTRQRNIEYYNSIEKVSQFTALLDELRKLKIKERVPDSSVVQQRIFTSLERLCREQRILKNENLSMYFRFHEHLVYDEKSHKAHKKLLPEPSALFPTHRGNKIIALYSNAYSNAEKNQGAYADICQDIQKAQQSVIIVGWAFHPSIVLLENKTLAQHIMDAASRGVKIIVLAWDNSYDPDAVSLDEHFGKLDSKIKENIIIKCSTRSLGYSDHQKMVIVDSKKLYLGGLDLAKDRDESWWHDCHTAVTGPVIKDAVKMVLARWLKIPYSSVVFPAENQELLNNQVEMLLVEMMSAPISECKEAKRDESTMQLLCSIKRRAWGLEQVGMWKSIESTYTCEIQTAYIEAISRAERFIYMENQYFCGPRKYKGIPDILGDNRAAKALADKIIQKHKEGKTFHFYCQLPFLPLGKSEVPIVARKNWKAIEWFIGEINKETHNQCEKYVTFYNLGSFIGDNFKQKYTHSKLLIVDDNAMIIGSANFNERSLAGNRDSEVCLLMRGQDREIFEYRKRLMLEHFGVLAERGQVYDVPESTNHVMLLRDVMFQNLKLLNSKKDFDHEKFGYALPWGNIPTAELSLGVKPAHVPDSTSFIVSFGESISDDVVKLLY